MTLYAYDFDLDRSHYLGIASSNYAALQNSKSQPVATATPFSRSVPSLTGVAEARDLERREGAKGRGGRMERALALSPRSPRFALSSGSRRPRPARLPSPTPQPLRSSNFGFLNSRRLRQGFGMRLRGADSRNSPGPGSSGDSESKAALDAFFLGKAFAEALNERIGSTVGEVLSVIGQWQAEQQKQVIDFQEEVVQRAKVAKEKAALEALEGQGVLSKPVMTISDSSSSEPAKDDRDPLEEIELTVDVWIIHLSSRGVESTMRKGE
ncbi:hypothetical protein Taro_040229 [Colocasia esculenta]|uniref:Uncharacterized protein n=1 Tax=Colocasia esculenta TaxID=4460 RepID=A0A843WCM8_COLES|nr:hypothetical protein [Colocasia esculenta]